MTPGRARELLITVSGEWLDDDASDVVAAEEYEGRWAVRMRQQVRDFTTVWFEVGDRTLHYEAYVLPAPTAGTAEVYRQALLRNRGTWRTHFSIDRKGDLFVEGRVAIDEVSRESLEQVLGAVYEAVELSFRGFVDAGFRREKAP